MAKLDMGSSPSQTTEVMAVFSISFTDGISLPVNIGDPVYDERCKDHYDLAPSKWAGSANTLPEALELAADYMAAFRKDMIAHCCEVPEGAQCFIDMRVCSTTGTSTQVVHNIS